MLDHTSIYRLTQACRRGGLELRDLMAEPLGVIERFTQANGISPQELTAMLAQLIVRFEDAARLVDVMCADDRCGEVFAVSSGALH